MAGFRWTVKQIQILRDNAGKMSSAEIGRLTGKSRVAVQAKASNLNISLGRYRENKTIITTDDRFIYITTNNTKKQYTFNYSERLLAILQDIKWYEDDKGYLSGKINGERYRAHWLVVGRPPKGMVVDHRNLDKTDNTDENLRHVTNQQNMENKSKPKNGITCKYKGVCWHRQHKKWYAQIQKDDKNSFLGLYLDPGDAARAYDRAAIELFGEYAATNEMLGLLESVS